MTSEAETRPSAATTAAMDALIDGSCCSLLPRAVKRDRIRYVVTVRRVSAPFSPDCGTGASILTTCRPLTPFEARECECAHVEANIPTEKRVEIAVACSGLGTVTSAMTFTVGWGGWVEVDVDMGGCGWSWGWIEVEADGGGGGYICRWI